VHGGGLRRDGTAFLIDEGPIVIELSFLVCVLNFMRDARGLAWKLLYV
jgi:hypothetical protein